MGPFWTFWLGRRGTRWLWKPAPPGGRRKANAARVIRCGRRPGFSAARLRWLKSTKSTESARAPLRRLGAEVSRIILILSRAARPNVSVHEPNDRVLGPMTGGTSVQSEQGRRGPMSPNLARPSEANGFGKSAANPAPRSWRRGRSNGPSAFFRRRQTICCREKKS